MDRQFIVVTNEITGPGGGGDRTGLAIAQEAQGRGLRAALATHVASEVEGIPDGLDFYPLFRVDHSGTRIADEMPGLYGLRGSLKALGEATIEDVLSGRATMEQYLLARFEPLEVVSPPGPPTAPPPPPAASRRARIKLIGKRCLPPVAVPAIRWVLRRRHLAKPAIRGLFPPIVFDRLKRMLRPSTSSAETAVAPPPPAATSIAPIPLDDRIETHLRGALGRADAANEARLWPLFLGDLERLLCLADVGPGDHVFLPTAHGREAYAIHRLVHELGEGRSPTFHLEFRDVVATLDELDSRRLEAGQLRYTRVHQAYFDACRAYPSAPRVRYYSGTADLAARYGQLAGFDFGVLPILYRPARLVDCLLGLDNAACANAA